MLYTPYACSLQRGNWRATSVRMGKWVLHQQLQCTHRPTRIRLSSPRDPSTRCNTRCLLPKRVRRAGKSAKATRATVVPPPAASAAPGPSKGPAAASTADEVQPFRFDVPSPDDIVTAARGRRGDSLAPGAPSTPAAAATAVTTAIKQGRTAAQAAELAARGAGAIATCFKLHVLNHVLNPVLTG